MYLEQVTATDLDQLGLDPAQVKRIDLIHERHGNRLYRISYDKRSYVLKWFEDPGSATEIRGYELLEDLGVPTLPVHGRAGNALLLKDLLTSATWRLATEADLERTETGAAVARWYRALHSAGREWLAGLTRAPSFLKREEDALNPATILTTGKKLGLAQDPVWKLAADHIEAIKGAMRCLSETLNYNDFYWSNLALSRQEQPESRAIVFDYHLLGIGLRYSDCRNVAGSLGERARAAFWQVYGPTDERERILDEATATLYGLVIAAQRPQFPRWAGSCLQAVKGGALEKSLRRALELT